MDTWKWKKETRPATRNMEENNRGWNENNRKDMDRRLPLTVGGGGGVEISVFSLMYHIGVKRIMSYCLACHESLVAHYYWLEHPSNVKNIIGLTPIETRIFCPKLITSFSRPNFMQPFLLHCQYHCTIMSLKITCNYQLHKKNSQGCH